MRRFTGEYEDGRQVYTDGDLYFDTVRRFKGQQAPAVLLVDVEPRDDRAVDSRLLYCGMTRATVHLELFAKRDNVYNKQHFL